MKYPDVASLVAAYKSGELTRPVMLDNDCVNVVVPENEDWIRAETVFESYPEGLLQDLLTYLGVPWDHV